MRHQDIQLEGAQASRERRVKVRLSEDHFERHHHRGDTGTWGGRRERARQKVLPVILAHGHPPALLPVVPLGLPPDVCAGVELELVGVLALADKYIKALERGHTVASRSTWMRPSGGQRYNIYGAKYWYSKSLDLEYPHVISLQQKRRD